MAPGLYSSALSACKLARNELRSGNCNKDARRMTPDLRVRFAGIELKNPVIAASGTFGYGVEFEDVVHLQRLGGIVVKGLSREPLIGNPPPRLYGTAAGMLNAIGLQNIGAPAFVDEKLPKLREIKNTVAIANGGSAGHAIKPIAVRMVYEASKSVQIPVIGIGGVSTAVDVIEFMLAGATAVQVGTASFWDPRATEKIAAELASWCKEHEVSKISELIGGLIL